MISTSLLLLAQTAAASPAANSEPGSPLAGVAQFLPFVCIAVIFYFLMIRPQQKKQKELQTLVSTLRTGDKVVTSSGIHGMISNVKEDTVLVKVADNVKIEFSKASITTVLKRSGEAEPAVAAPAATVVK